MVYKFDILFKKNLKSGGLKVVTYTNLLDNPKIFGSNEDLVGVEGELSMVLEGPEEGYSINSLYRKYRAQLVGHKNAELLGKDFPLCFVFADAYNPYSIKIAQFTDLIATCITGVDTFMLLVAKDTSCTISQGVTTVTLKRGQAAFCAASTELLSIEPDSSSIILVN